MILGMDTSRWKDNPATPVTIDWQKAKSAGVRFVIMKTTEGISWKDPVFDLHSKALAGLLPRGTFHYWRPQNSATAQAKFYYSVARGLELPPVLDVEDWYKELPKGLELVNKVVEMLSAIDAAFGRSAILYTSPNIIQYYMGLKNLTGSPLLMRKLWIANYEVDKPDIKPWGRWTFWQHTEQGPAAKYGINEAGFVDLDLYNGDQALFEAEFGLDLTAETPAPVAVKVTSVEEEGVKLQKLMTVRVEVNGSSYNRTIDQRPVVPPPPPVTPPIDEGIWEILDDSKAMATGAFRPYVRNGLPETVRFHPIITASGKYGEGGVTLPADWMAFAVEINPGRAFKYQFNTPTEFNDEVGWHNRAGARRVECLTMAGNRVRVKRIEKRELVIDGKRQTVQAALIDCYTVNQRPPAARLPMPVDGHGTDTLIHNFSIGYRPSANHPNGWTDMSTDGRFARLFPIANEGEELWMDLRDLVKVEG
jgi:lysozyme